MNIKIITIIILLSVFSCNFFIDKKQELSFDEDTFKSNYTQWIQSENKNYEFIQKYSSTSTGPQPEIKVEVSNGKFVSSTIISNESDIHKYDFRRFDTITEIYEFVDEIAVECKENIASDQHPMLSAEIEIEYDETYHYPIMIDCSGSYEAGYAGGLSLILRISKFELK